MTTLCGINYEQHYIYKKYFSLALTYIEYRLKLEGL